MGQAGGGFTECEWFGENLSICRYARSKSVCLYYFVILVYDVLGKSLNFETLVVIVRSVYTLQSLCSYSKVSVIFFLTCNEKFKRDMILQPPCLSREKLNLLKLPLIH